MKSATAIKSPNGHGSVYKEVRFSPTPTPVRRTQSVPNAHPVLNTHGAAGVTYSSLSASYLDQARLLLDRQRISFENEKKLFNEERQLWEKERALLKSRISELEALLKGRGSTASATVLPPGAFAFADQFHASAQVWEGSSPGSRPTRVFPDAETTDIHTLSSIPEQGAKYVSAPSLDAALSPKSHAVDPSTGASVPVPIEKLDSKLDGITLKSSALPPEVVARVITPPSPSSLETSPTSSTRPPNEHRNSLKLRLSELGPPEFNLTRNAGHTPMAKIDRDIDTEQPSPQEVQDEASPLAPAVLRQPAEQSDSYFADLPEDPALKGPLSLLNEEEHDSSFLKELDQRLLDQVKQVLGHHRRGSREEREDEEDEAEPRSQGETDEPELRFKKTTNFGTAFGNSDCGKV
ncbi:hypothetical protein BO86DRAFT_313267 [Aspergillus japonicus CBS 114.51]|uniref:Uncharacterized protein n=2 Tax=Aspergillus TaxID=5052 RepID=A0A2V5H8S5_ASPV1|nr:hypothetical protein BO86DRAFT_313267 [Aspergillus japonicus CBS 114.51]PYI20728.1 hypothetical protein BO99DRAFT_330170 [Aspergillus violaceofuscus CBS 115571]RAH81847.1 hypothetical protein BO86DRAFT_313267 [Aspergillus japonicus CBS 114.51]